MIEKIIKEYTTNDLSEFANNYPDRYNNLCTIVGEYQLGARRVILSIDLGNSKDVGCVTNVSIKDNNFVIDNIQCF